MGRILIQMPLWIVITILQLNVFAVIAVFIYYRKFRLTTAKYEDSLKQKQDQVVEQKLKVAEMELQIESLDSFQELYYELQEQYKALQEKQEEFEDRAQDLLSEEERAEIEDSLKQLQIEKEKLESRLQAVDKALTEILERQTFDAAYLDSEGQAALDAVDRVEQEVAAINRVIEQQQAIIGQLNQQIDTMQLESKDKQDLEQVLEELREQNATMQGAVTNLQQENSTLREQVKKLEVKERVVNEGDHEAADQIDQLKQALADKERAYAELERKFQNTEAEYLKIYTMLQKLQA